MEINLSEKEDKELFDILTSVAGGVLSIGIRNQPIASFFEIKEIQEFRSSQGQKATIVLEKLP
mgnify:FL=1